MTEVDLSRLPTGEMGWLRLVDYVLRADDRVERYFLEVKSEVDLNTKRDRAKVAKYILGAANRDPVQAGRRFGGHALMILGIGDGTVVGVPSFEAKDLAATVQRLIGVDGPRWDFERISIEGCDVIVVVVDPPSGNLWTCRADGDGLVDGGIYVRADGETRRATGDEIRSLIARASTKLPPIAVDVSIEGEVLAIQFDESVLRTWIDDTADTLRDQVRLRQHSKLSWPTTSLDTRSRTKFLSEVESWKRRALEFPARGLVNIAGSLYTGVRVSLANHSRTFLRNVRLDIYINDEVIATDWRAEDDVKLIDLLPDRPVDWGEKTISFDLSLGAPDISGVGTSQSRHGIVDIRRAKPVYLNMHMESLRPEEMHISDDDEVVLLMFGATVPSTVAARWRLTAQDINDVFEGTVDIPVKAVDWRESIRKMLPGDDETEDA